MQVHCDSSAAFVWRIRLAPDQGERIAISDQGLLQLSNWLEQAQQTKDCRVIVLEGQAGAFCHGMDLDLALQSEDFYEDVPRFAACLLALRQARQAIIVAVDGVAVAGGVGLIAAADLVLATETSSFGLPEITLGLLPAMVLPLLQERMSPQKARLFAMMGTSIGAQRAHEWGLIDEYVTDSTALDKRLRRWLRQFLRTHPDALADLKRQSLASPQPLEIALQQGANYTAKTLQQPERLAGIRHFLAGENPPWFQRYRPPNQGQTQ